MIFNLTPYSGPQPNAMFDTVWYHLFVLFGLAYAAAGSFYGGRTQLRKKVILSFGGGMEDAKPMEWWPSFWKISTALLFTASAFCLTLFLFLAFRWFWP